MASVAMSGSRASCPAAIGAARHAAGTARPPRPGEPAECRGAGIRHSRTPARPNVTNDVGTVRGDQARVVRLRMIGQIPPRLGLAVTRLFDERPDGRLGIALVDGLDGDVGNAHSATLANAERRTVVLL
jgi:hypothetical protein